MRRLSIRVLSLLALGLLAGCAEGPPVQVSDAWIRAAPPGASATAGYLRLSNRGEGELRLESVTSPALGRVEIHETTMTDGVMRMRRLDALAVPAGGELTLAPGGRHLMIFADRMPAAGERIPLVLGFSDGSELAIEAEVRRVAR